MGVEIRLLRHVAHALLVGDQVAPDGLAVKKDLARAGLDEPGDHFHGGGFSGAVGAQVTGDFARGGGEADVIYGEDARETLGDVAQFERHNCRLLAAFKKRLLRESARRNFASYRYNGRKPETWQQPVGASIAARHRVRRSNVIRHRAGSHGSSGRAKVGALARRTF